MPEKKITEEESRMQEIILRTGGSIQELIHDAIQQSDEAIGTMSAAVLQHDLSDLSNQRSIEEAVKYYGSFVGQQFRGASWLFTLANSSSISGSRFGQKNAWGSHELLSGLRAIRLLDEKTVLAFGDRILLAKRNDAKQKIEEEVIGTIPRPLLAAHFHEQGNWILNTTSLCFISSDLKRKKILDFYIQGHSVQFIAADHQRRAVFLLSGTTLWRVNITGFDAEQVPLAVTAPERVRSFNGVTSFRDMRYSVSLGILYFIPDNGDVICAYHPFGMTSLRLGGTTHSISIPAPLRPYRDFTVQCLIQFNSMGANELLPVFSGDFVPNLFIRTADNALVFRWYAGSLSNGEPIVEAEFPNATEHCTGKWITLTMSMRGKRLEIYCNGKYFSRELPFICPAFWDVRPWNFYLGANIESSTVPGGNQSADYCIAELMFWDHALDAQRAKQSINSWTICSEQGFPKGLRQYYRFDTAKAAVFQREDSTFEYQDGTEHVTQSRGPKEYHSAERSASIPDFYRHPIIVAAARYGEIISNLSICETSQRIFWAEELSASDSWLSTASALGVEPMDMIEVLPRAATVIDATWQGVTHVQILQDARHRQLHLTESGNDLLHAARMQTHFELEWMQKENKQRMQSAAESRAEDDTVPLHHEKHKSYLLMRDDRRRLEASEKFRLAAGIRNARFESLQLVRTAEAEAIQSQNEARRKK